MPRVSASTVRRLIGTPARACEAVGAVLEVKPTNWWTWRVKPSYIAFLEGYVGMNRGRCHGTALVSKALLQLGHQSSEMVVC